MARRTYSAAFRTTLRFEGRSRAVADRLPVVQSGPYAGFISYARRTDCELAIALQIALQQFGKPWYRRSALRVFRDDAVLAANPDLWLSLQAALDKSDHLILLASPASALSPWIAREVSYWMEHKDPDAILIAVTAGNLDGASSGEVNPWTEVLPRGLADRFSATSPPRIVDFRGLRPDQFSLRDPTFSENVLDLAAPLHRRAKMDLYGEDVRQHARTVRVFRAAVAVLATLLLVASITTVVAFTERGKALRQLDVATSVQLASQSELVAVTDPRLAALLSVTAAYILDTPESRAAMTHQLQRSTQTIAFFGDDAVAGGDIAFGADGRTLLSSDLTGSRAWDLSTHHATPLLPDGTDADLSGFSRNRQKAILVDDKDDDGEDDGIQLVDIESGERTQLPDGEGPGAFSPDDRVLATGSTPQEHRGQGVSNPPIILWDTTNFTRIETLPPEAGSAPWAFSPDGRILAIDPGINADIADVVLWDVAGRRQLHALANGHDRGIFSLAFSPDGRTVATGGHDARIVLWDVQSGAQRLSWETQGDVHGIAFSDDGTFLVSGDGNKEVIVWDPLSGNRLHTFRGHLSAVTGVDTAGDMVASVDQTGQIAVWDIGGRDWLLNARIPGPGYPTTFRNDGEILATTDPAGTSLSAWRVSTQALLDVEPAGVPSPDWSKVFVNGATPTNVTTAVGADKVTDSEKVLEFRLDALAGAGDPIAVSPDGKFLVARDADGDGVTIWDIERRLPDNTFGTMTVGDVTFSPDSRFIALGGIDSIIIWDTRQRAQVQELLGFSSTAVQGIAFSPDGTRLLWTGNEGAVTSIGCSGCNLLLWSLAQNSLVRKLPGHEVAPTSVATSSDGRLMASAGGKVILWSADRLATIADFPAATGPVLFNPAGTVLATGGPDHSVYLWDVAPQSWKAKLCRIAGRSLSPTEWSLYIGDRPYETVCAG